MIRFGGLRLRLRVVGLSAGHEVIKVSEQLAGLLDLLPQLRELHCGKESSVSRVEDCRGPGHPIFRLQSDLSSTLAGGQSLSAKTIRGCCANDNLKHEVGRSSSVLAGRLERGGHGEASAGVPSVTWPRCG